MAAEEQAAELLERAAELDRRAYSDEALELLEGCGTWPVPYNERGLLLRANILIATRDPIAALDELPEDAEAFTTHEGRVEYFLASAWAYIGTRNWRAADGMLSAAESLISASDLQRFRLAFLRARIRWSLRQYDPDDSDLALAMEAPDIPSRFHAINLRSWMRGGLEDYRGQIADLTQCLALYDLHPGDCEARSVAIALRSTLGFAWEMADFDACRMAVQSFDAMSWVPAIRLQRFYCLRGLTWQAFLQGDMLGADSYLDAETSEVTGPALTAMAHADRAHVAGLSGDIDRETEELRSARVSADAVDWKAMRDDEHEVLLTLAALLAKSDPDDAERYLSVHYSLYAHGRRENLDGSHESRRSAAFVNYAEGRVQHAQGNLNLAARSLENAYNVFASLEYEFRALLAARALFQITGQEQWLQSARLHAAAFPNHILSRCLFEAPLLRRD